MTTPAPETLTLTVPADKAGTLRKCAELLSAGGSQARALEELVAGELVAISAARPAKE